MDGQLSSRKRSVKRIAPAMHQNRRVTESSVSHADESRESKRPRTVTQSPDDGLSRGANIFEWIPSRPGLMPVSTVVKATLDSSSGGLDVAAAPRARRVEPQSALERSDSLYVCLAQTPLRAIGSPETFWVRWVPGSPSATPQPVTSNSPTPSVATAPPTRLHAASLGPLAAQAGLATSLEQIESLGLRREHGEPSSPAHAPPETCLPGEVAGDIVHVKADSKSLRDAMVENAKRALDSAEAGRLDRSTVAVPVDWRVKARSELAGIVASQVAMLADRGYVRDECLYVVVTGFKGGGKTTAMRAIMQSVHLSLYGGPAQSSNSPQTRFVQGYFRRPLFAQSPKTSDLFTEPPAITDVPVPGCLPVPIHLLAIEVLRAHGVVCLPGLHGVAADHPDLPASLCWSEDAYSRHALDVLSAWLATRHISIYTYIDELQSVFSTEVELEYSTQWLNQLCHISYGVYKMRLAFCFSGSSSLLPRIMCTREPISSASAVGLGSVPPHRSPIHAHRITFIHTYPPVTESAFRWLVKYQLWPEIDRADHSKLEIEALYISRAGERLASSKTLGGDDSSAFGYAGMVHLQRELYNTRLGPVYKAMAAALAWHPFSEHQQRLCLSTVFDRPGVRLVVPKAEILRRLNLLAELGVDARAREVVDAFHSDTFDTEIRIWKDQGYLLSEVSGIGFPSILLLLTAVEHLLQGSLKLHTGFVRAVFAPEGVSAARYGEPLAAAGLCERNYARKRHNLGWLVKTHVHDGAGIDSSMLRQVKTAVARAKWFWKAQDNPLEGLDSGHTLLPLPLSKAINERWYKPVPDVLGVDFIGLTTTKSGEDVLVGVQVKLSAGDSEVKMTLSAVKQVGTRFSQLYLKSSIQLLGNAYGKSTSFNPIFVMILVTNRLVQDDLKILACKVPQGLLLPPRGAAAIFSRSEMASCWPSPARVLAHDFGLGAWGAPISDVMELQAIRRSTSSTSSCIARAISPDAIPQVEEAEQVERATQEAERKAKQAEHEARQMVLIMQEEVTRVLMQHGLARHAQALIHAGVTTQSLRSAATDKRSRKALSKVAVAAGLSDLDVLVLMKIVKNLQGGGD